MININNKEIKKMGWYYIWVLILAVSMAFSNLTGYRILTFGGQQQWAPGGPTAYHK